MTDIVILSATRTPIGAFQGAFAGVPAPILYPGSYSDWSRHGLPAATGPAPGSP